MTFLRGRTLDHSILIQAVSSWRFRTAGALWAIAFMILVCVIAVPFTRWNMRVTTPESPPLEDKSLDSARERLKWARWEAAWNIDWTWWKPVRRVLLWTALAITVAGCVVLFI